MSVVRTYYFTDPACPWSWALEPTVRRLAHDYGQSLSVTYVMAGMAREFGDAGSLVRESLEAGAASGMPVDPRLWFEGAPKSSYPACIAVKAASEQGDPAPYLRRLREGFLCRRRRLDGAEALLEEARVTGGLDLDRFRIDLSSHAVLEAFGADLERARAVATEHHAEGAKRVTLPSLEFHSGDGGVRGVYCYTSYDELDAAAAAAGAKRAENEPPSVEEALRAFGSMATAEVSSVCRLPGPRAPAELWRLATEWRAKPERLGSGELWTLT